MTSRGLVLAAALALASPAVGQEAGGGARRANPKPPAASAQTDALLRQLAEAQRGLGEQMQELREAVDGLRGELARQEDQETGLVEEVKSLREEVKGLYVENSSVKEQIDGLKEDVSGVNANVSAFRTFSGFFIAVMIVLLAGSFFLLTIRR